MALQLLCYGWVAFDNIFKNALFKTANGLVRTQKKGNNYTFIWPKPKHCPPLLVTNSLIRPHLTNQTKPNQTKPNESNLTNQIYQSKTTNQTNQSRTYQIKSTKSNLAKFNFELLIRLKHSRKQKNSTLGSVVLLTMLSSKTLQYMHLWSKWVLHWATILSYCSVYVCM